MLRDDCQVVVEDGGGPDDLYVLVLQDDLGVVLALPEVEAGRSEVGLLPGERKKMRTYCNFYQVIGIAAIFLVLPSQKQ